MKKNILRDVQMERFFRRFDSSSGYTTPPLSNFSGDPNAS